MYRVYNSSKDRPAFNNRSNRRPGGKPQGSYGNSSGSAPSSTSGSTSSSSTGSSRPYSPRSSYGRPSQGGYRGGASSSYGTRRPQKRSFGGQHIDVSRFINKAEITELVEHFVPEHKFSDFAIDAGLKQNIKEKGFTSPTPIQDRSIPHILRGSDVVGIANTGTGKTAAFLIPLISKICISHTERVLIVVPTRELALQIQDELRFFTPNLRISSAVCVGGTPMGRQIADIRRNPHFIIGTPGRLKDLIQRKVLNLSQFRNVVLDEADRMLDMGFINDMRFLMSGMPSERQTLFFSATFSPEIEKLVAEFLREPIRISVKTQDTSKNVDQDIIRVPAGENKIDVLKKLLAQPEFNKVLIFGRTKHGVEKLSRILHTEGIMAESIHGDKTQSRRQQALSQFKTGELQALIATDVAARGLDIPDVSHVINFDVPATYEDYIHRIGRTGRGDKKGKALTFVD